jgi:cytidylate kinase
MQVSMKQKITIAIDGHSSCGKSTLARDLAKELNYIYVDSGAMYRAVTYYALQNGWIKNGELNASALIDALIDITIFFKKPTVAAHPEVYLNGENVEDKIRGLEVSSSVSKVAAIKEVRKFLVDQQRMMGEQGGVVMDGRDIGSVVFPNAELKIFLTADTDIRAERRYKELTAKGEDVDLSAIKANLIQRDHLDSTRKESPLIQTEDAVVVDNTKLSRAEQLLLLKQLVSDRIVTI